MKRNGKKQKINRSYLSVLQIFKKDVHLEENIAQQIRVGIIGDFDSSLVSHTATNDALSHAAKTMALDLDIEWLPTAALENNPAKSNLKQFDGLWGAPGSPYQSMDGALRAIRFCRENRWPFLGT